MSAYSANAPCGRAVSPITRSPGAKPVTPGPTSMTSPHNSTPSVNGSGIFTW